MSKIFQATAIRGAPLDLFARLTAAQTGSMTASPVAKEGYLIKQEDVAGIVARSYVNGEQIATTSPGVSDVIFDALQTAAVWGSVGGLGGNFKYQCPAEFFDTDALTVRVEFEVTLQDGTNAPYCVDVDVLQDAG